MKKSDRTERLHALMDLHQLDCPAVGEILNRTAQTVRVWRSWSARPIPADALRLLESEAPKFAASRDIQQARRK